MLSTHTVAKWLPESIVRQVGKQPHLRRLARRARHVGPVTIPHGGAAGMQIWSDERLNLGYTLGTTEPAVQEAIVAHLSAGEVCYDVGANVGFHTLIAAKAVGPAGRVYAFEPLPENADDLRRNVSLNRLDNVEVFQAAVSDYVGSAKLELGESSLDPRLIEHRQDPGSDQIEVQVLRLDDAGLRPPNLIKIDAEGAEFAVLNGMRRLVEQHRPVILCEMHTYRDSHLDDVRDTLAVDGYEFRFVEPDASEKYWAPHVLALPGHV